MNQKAMVFMGMGFELAGLAVAATYVGKYIDNYLGWSIGGTMILVIASLVLWFVHIFYLLKQLEKSDEP
jgi:hypothetical protein